ncbi:protein pxr-1-like [Miscanthus floridulus]|uniref:protein pxr-1-like n=1 Tax=Miscanthus floridulus TaxID=154761 RepID=UPI00345A2DE2
MWDVVENEFVILDPTNLTDIDKIIKQCNTMALNTIYNGIDSKVFEQIKDLEKASEVWVRLEETYEGTSMVKSAKLYMFKDKISNFKMKDGESIPEMFYRLQVIMNDLKSLGEKVKDEDFSHKFLIYLPKRFETLRTIIFRGGLKDVTPNEVLGDVMTEDQYNSDGEELVKEEDKKKRSVAFKASSSSKNKGKSKKESSDDKDLSNIDDEAIALFVRKMGKFMKKKGYGARKRRDHTKSKEYVRRCYNCKCPDYVVADCPYNSDNDEDEKKKHKKEKKEKKEKTKTLQKKKKGGGYVVTWDSDGSSDTNDSSDDDKKSIKKALANITMNDKPSIFDTPSACLMAKPTKIKYDVRRPSERLLTGHADGQPKQPQWSIP